MFQESFRTSVAVQVIAEQFCTFDVVSLHVLPPREILYRLASTAVARFQ